MQPVLPWVYYVAGLSPSDLLRRSLGRGKLDLEGKTDSDMRPMK